MLKKLTKNQSYLLLLLVCIISRLATSIYYIEDIDSLRFALSLDDYSITKLQPHFPGYPVFCYIAKLLLSITGSKAASFSLIGAFSIFTIIYYILKISKIEINNRIGIFCSLMIFFNPLLWLMSNRYMPDLMGLAIAVSCIYYLTENSNNTKNLIYGYIFIGLLIGVRLSYIPFIIVPFIYHLIKNDQRVYLFLSCCLGILVWFIPLIYITGYENLYLAASKQTVGHFTDYGGTVLTDNNLYFRSLNLLRSIWADGLGGYWPGRAWQTGFLSVSYAYFLYLGYIGSKQYLKYDKNFVMIIYCIALYILWIFFFQNVIYKTRHILPILIIVFLLVTIGQKYVAEPKAILYNTLLGAFFIALATVTLTLVTQHKNPTAVSRLKDSIILSHDAGTIISTPLINYYMQRHAVKSNFINIKDKDQISRFNSSENDQALIIGNFQGLFENNYSVIPETTYFHNPYVNRMWPSIHTYRLYKNSNVFKE